MQYWPGQTKEIGFSLSRNKTKPKLGFKLNLLLNLNLKSTSPLMLIAVGMIGLVYFAGQINKADAIDAPSSQYSESKITQKPAEKKAYSLAYSKPVNIKIDKFDLDTAIQPVGQNQDKSIQIPEYLDMLAGWYKYGPAPGELGPAVIVGHVGIYKGQTVFYNLHSLAPGDKIEILRQDNKTAKFKVTSLEQYSQESFPSDKVYGDIDYAGLRLITCGGQFDKKTGKYSDNTVVYAKLIK